MAEMSFSYAILRVVPSVERGEAINVGVVMYSRQHDEFLGLRVRLDDARLAALSPDCDPEPIRARLTALDLPHPPDTERLLQLNAAGSR